MIRKAWKWILAIFLLVFIAFVMQQQCSTSSSKNLTNSNPYKQDSSVLIIPVEIDISSFESVINAEFDKKGWLYEEPNIEVNRQLSIAYRVKKQGKAQLYPQNNAIHIQIPLYIEIYPNVSSSLSLGLGRNMQLQAKVILNSEISPSLTSDWTTEMDSKTTFDIVEAPTLSILGLSIDFGNELKKSLSLANDEMNTLVQNQVKEVIDTEGIVALVWDEVKEPYQITDKPTTWIQVNPKSVYATDIQPSSPGVIEIIFKIIGMVSVNTQANAPQPSKKQLPNAEIVETINERKSELNFPVIIEVEELFTYLNQFKDGYEFKIKGRPIMLKNFSGNVDEQKLKINASFESKEVIGTVTIEGTPFFNQEKQQISLTNTRITPTSNYKQIDQLINTAQRTGLINKQIEEAMKFSFDKQIEEFNLLMTQQLKATTFNEYAALDGYVDQLQVNDLYLQKDKILLDVTLTTGVKTIVGAN